jgi:Mg2+-importing ATPase
LGQGVLEGRKVFGNISKYIRMGAGSNLGNMLGAFEASFFLPYLPMLEAQILVYNLLHDLSLAAIIPTDNGDEDFLTRPRDWRVGGIKRSILHLGPVSPLLDYATFVLGLYFFNCWGNPALFQTGWFIKPLLSQTLIVHILRTHKAPFFQGRASLPLTLTTLTSTRSASGCPSHHRTVA